MIRADALGELKDSAAGLVALSELLASRRVGFKAIGLALPSVREACAGVVIAAEKLCADVLVTARENQAASAEIRAVYDRAIASVQALEAEIAAGENALADARGRLVLERAAHGASAHVAASLFAAEMFAAASAPRTVTVRVADVLAFGPVLADGPHVVRATLDAPPDPVATTDARLLRALVELSVQIAAAAGVAIPHVEVTSRPNGGARVRIGSPAEPPSLPAPSPAPRRPARRVTPQPAMLAVRRLPWSAEAHHLARTVASMTGAEVLIDLSGRTITVTFS